MFLLPMNFAGNKKQSVHYRIPRSYKDTLLGPSDKIRTCGILLPKQARYQLRYTRIQFVLYRIPAKKAIAIYSGLLSERGDGIMAPKGGAAYEKKGGIVPGVAEGYRLPDHADRSYGGSVWAAYVAAGNRTAGVPDLLLSDCGGDCAHRKGVTYDGKLCLAVLSEPIYDFVLYGNRNTWLHQNVLWLLLLGAVMLFLLEKGKQPVEKLLVVASCYFLADWLHLSYGGDGILLMALFGLTRGVPGGVWIQTAGMLLINGMMSSACIVIFGVSVSVQLFGVLAMVPIALYSGQKRTKSRAMSWAFYIFYPLHLLILYGLCMWLG